MDATPPVVSVSQAIQFCNSLFAEFELWVEGEVANYTVSRGKFVFFDLKDETQEARLSCFMMLYQQNIPLEDGMRVVVRARPTVFTKSGKFSLTVNHLEARGEGSVKRAFELLKAKLEKEGLFAHDRKRLLPRFVREVGIISSADAAGYGDFMRLANSRLPGILFRFVNVAVQGNDAEAEICAAFDLLNGRYQLDAIVLIRGGGSMEDLHAFNSEPVARAIVRSKAPVVVGVGHERDVTIADFCADVRASTPSNAAQILLPTREEVVELVRRLTHQGQRRVGQIITDRRQHVVHTIRHLHDRIRFIIEQQRQRVKSSIKTITAISPIETLKRGYSITKKQDGSLIRSVHDTKKGDILITTVRDGRIESQHS